MMVGSIRAVATEIRGSQVNILKIEWKGFPGGLYVEYERCLKVLAQANGNMSTVNETITI